MSIREQRERGPRRPERTGVAPRRSGPGRSRPATTTTSVREILRAELLGLLRDRRALFSAFVLPMLLYPLMFLGNSWLERLSRETLQARTVHAALDLSAAPADHATRLRDLLGLELPIEMVDVPAADLARDRTEDPNAERAAATRILALGHDIILVARPLPGPPGWALATYYDSTNDVGNEAALRAGRATLALHDELGDARRREVLDVDPARGLALQPIDVATVEETSGAELGRYLPLLAVFVLLAGASYAALSAFAGERESGTLETLLVQPVSSGRIVAAKFIAVLIVGIVTLVLNAGSVIACLAFGLGRLPGSHAQGTLAVDAGRILLAAGLFVPAAVLLCAVLCLACGRARTFREGQQTLLPLLLLAVLPTLPAMQPDIELDWLLAAIPLCGPSLALRDALRGEVAPGLALWMFVASSGWAFMALRALATRLDSERLLQHADNTDEIARREVQSRYALRWGLVAVFGVYLVGGWLQSLNAAWGLGATLWILLPTFALLSVRGTARRANESIAVALQWRAPRIAHLCAAVLLAPALALAAQHLFAWQKNILPMPASFEDVNLPLEIAGLSPFVQLLLLALSPAICEELFFRGALLSGLRRDLSTWRVIVWEAFLFGAMHASIYRFVPAGILGAILTLLALRSKSLFPAIALHCAYNALLVMSDVAPRLSDPRVAYLAVPGLALLVLPARGTSVARKRPE